MKCSCGGIGGGHMPKCPHAPSEGTKALKKALQKLHAVEHDLELANALTPTDHRLNEAEIALHECVVRVERIERGEREPACSGVLVHSEYERCERCDK